LMRALLDSIIFEKESFGTHVRTSLLFKSALRNYVPRALGVLSMIIYDLPIVSVMLVILGTGRPFEQV
jgi:hypothetical protein